MITLAYRSIVVPLDGSSLAEQALPYARRLAEVSDGRIWLIRAVDMWGMTPKQRAEKELVIKREAQTRMPALALSTIERGVPTDWEVTSGEAGAVIAAAASSHGADLIVMSTHGRSGLGRYAYGSVAERLLRDGRWPALLIPPDCPSWEAQTPPRKVVLVPLDGSARAEAALPDAVALARALTAQILLVRVTEPGTTLTLLGPVEEATILEQEASSAEAYMTTIHDQLTAQGCIVESRVQPGYAARTIADTANDEHAIAIAMASHGRTGIARMVMGSVATGVIQRVAVPVLVRRPATLIA